jgi:nucleotide-binding universal stress UspA family protein
MTARRVLVGLDGSPGAAVALDWCRQYAGILDAEVIAVHVIPILAFTGYPPADVAKGRTLEQMHSTMERALEGWVAPLRAAGVPCRTVVLDDNPAPALDATAIKEDCDLIVVGRRGCGGFRRARARKRAARALAPRASAARRRTRSRGAPDRVVTGRTTT